MLVISVIRPQKPIITDLTHHLKMVDEFCQQMMKLGWREAKKQILTEMQQDRIRHVYHACLHEDIHGIFVDNVIIDCLMQVVLENVKPMCVLFVYA